MRITPHSKKPSDGEPVFRTLGINRISLPIPKLRSQVRQLDRGKPKREVGREPRAVALERFVEPTGRNSVQPGEICVENHPVATDREDQRLQRLLGYSILPG